MRISDWSSDVCSSDLIVRAYLAEARALGATDKEISTAGISINPEYVWDDKAKKQKLVGYRARRDIAVTVSNLDKLGDFVLRATKVGIRSEEHTSELQSLMRISYAVFCLKKKTHQHHTVHT